MFVVGTFHRSPLQLEEDCGQLALFDRLLHLGLKFCPYSENLLTKVVRHEEQAHNLTAARALLGHIRFIQFDQSWRLMLEGALLEARAGETQVARRVFQKVR